MSPTAWTANTLVIASFFLVSRGIIKGDGKIFNFAALTIATLYLSYSIAENIAPLLILNVIYITISTRTLHLLYTDPQKTKKHFTLSTSTSITLIITINIITAIATKSSLSNIILITGTTTSLIAYFLVAGGKIQGDKLAFNYMRLIAAILVGIYTIMENKHEILAIEIFLSLIAITAIRKSLKQRR